VKFFPSWSTFPSWSLTGQKGSEEHLDAGLPRCVEFCFATGEAGPLLRLAEQPPQLAPLRAAGFSSSHL
jgi:hypothetical protein